MTFLGFLAYPTEFQFGDGSGSFGSCSFILNGNMMIVGGDDIYDFSNQISIVEDCGLRRIGDMPADFAYGACTALETDALLCFSWNDMDGCYR